MAALAICWLLPPICNTGGSPWVSYIYLSLLLHLLSQQRASPFKSTLHLCLPLPTPSHSCQCLSTPALAPFLPFHEQKPLSSMEPSLQTPDFQADSGLHTHLQSPAAQSVNGRLFVRHEPARLVIKALSLVHRG